MKFLVPKFYNDFNCIGSKCEYSCCIGWQVLIDKKTYKEYKTYKKNKYMRDMFMKNIKRLRNSTSNDAYAKIIMDENKRCPFLDENNLCLIYINCGEEFMSKTCKIYPRLQGHTRDFWEIGLSLSCPEVLRVGLLNEEKMEFDVFDSEFEKDIISNFSYTDFKDKEMDIFWEIRSFSIALIQNRNYDIDERLSILSIIMNKIDILLKNKEYNKIKSKIEFYQSLINNNEFKDILKHLNIDKEFQLIFINEISGLGYKKDGSNSDYSDIYLKSLKNINYNKGDIDIADSNYNKLYEKYRKIEKEKLYIFENFLILNMFNSKFPYSLSLRTNIMDNLFSLMLKYVIFKFNLIAHINECEEKSFEEVAIKIIYIMSRFMNHNESYVKAILNYLDNNDKKTLEHMILLIKE